LEQEIGDVFVIKLDSSGNLSWAKTIGGTNYDYGYSIQQTSDGGYVITGELESFGAGNGDVFVIKLDSSGNIPGCSSVNSPESNSFFSKSNRWFSFSILFLLQSNRWFSFSNCFFSKPKHCFSMFSNFQFHSFSFNSSRKLAIGVTSTQYQLEVAGKIKATQICLGPQCYSSIPEVWWQKTGNNIVYNAGNVGIGTTTPSSKLTVSGDLFVTATTTLGSATSTPIIFTGYTKSDIIPYTDLTYNLGSSSYRWANLYAGTTTIGGTTVIGSDTITADQDSIWKTTFGNLTIQSAASLNFDSITSIVFKNNGVEKFRLTPEGKLAIGIKNPRDLFEIGSKMSTSYGDSFSITHTSDTDFASGTSASTTILGSGDAASIILNRIGDHLAVTSSLPQVTFGLSCVESSFNHKIYCFGGNNGSPINNIVEYNPSNNTAFNTSTLPSVNSGLSCAEDSSTYKIYCFGGYNGSTRLNQIVRYDPLTNTVTTMSSTLGGGRDGLSCAENSSTHKIYCFGGYTGSVYLNSIVEYNPSNDTIATTSATLPTLMANLSCVENSSTHKIYCFGGNNGNSHYNTIVKYNPSNNTITTMSATLPYATRGLSCAEDSSTNKIYCFGGYTPGPTYRNEIVEYNPSNDTITTMSATLPTGRVNLSCAENSSTHKIYCFGGYQNIGSYTNQILEYYLTYPSSGYYISPIIDTTFDDLTYGYLDFTILKPSNTDLKFQLRADDSTSTLVTLDFLGPDGSTSTYYSTSGTNIYSNLNNKRYIQYKAFFSSNGSATPSLKDIILIQQVPAPLLLLLWILAAMLALELPHQIIF
jgi:N-acetylneuraminic acid mutarotase